MGLLSEAMSMLREAVINTDGIAVDVTITRDGVGSCDAQAAVMSRDYQESQQTDFGGWAVLGSTKFWHWRFRPEDYAPGGTETLPDVDDQITVTIDGVDYVHQVAMVAGTRQWDYVGPMRNLIRVSTRQIEP